MKKVAVNAGFSPIAIVGRACVLPGALDPQAMWEATQSGRDLTSAAPAGRWGVKPARIFGQATGSAEAMADRTWSDRGGYVRGFEGVFDGAGFELPADEILSLDPLFQWVLHTGRVALDGARWSGRRTNAGAVIGNLSYPASAMSQYAEHVWLHRLASQLGETADKTTGRSRPDARNRFMSGLPAHLLAKGLGLGAGAFALDAACASSLYAIKLACDALHAGRADLMLAGAVNRADDLFLHVGFSALKALSPTGQSRPFHADADGLLPAEGACMFALRRLEDAERDGGEILGVIRSVGLSNDGRGRGFLVPSQAGQVRAVTQALNLSGLSPSEIGYVECHATGTVVGDATEIATLNEVFGHRGGGLPIGSFKANAGHLITAAGGAGLLKVLGAMEHGEFPPTPHLDALNPALMGTSLRLLRSAESWADGPVRRAGVSAFGFGGNNAHMIVEQWRRGGLSVPIASKPVAPQVAVVAMGARVSDGQSAVDFESSLFDEGSRVPRVGGGESCHADVVTVPVQGLKFPPADLQQTLPQQLLLLEAAREAAAGLKLNPERTGVLVGMGCDPEVARHGARWRMIEWAERWGAYPGWVRAARDGFVPLLGAAGVVGAMPNVVANRINSQFNFSGPSFTVSSEELSGVRALELAAGALQRGELDAALVGAVDICAEEVHQSAALQVLSADRQRAGDAAIVLVLKRLEDAQADGDRVLAVLHSEGEVDGTEPDLDLHTTSLVHKFGHAHAASGLVHVAAAVLSCARGCAPAGLSAAGGGASRSARVSVQALGGQSAQVRLSADTAQVGPIFSARDLQSGPSLSVPVHRPPPAVPALSGLRLPEPEVMAKAPALPPELERVSNVRVFQGTPMLKRIYPESQALPEIQAQPASTVIAAGPLPALNRHMDIQRAMSLAHQQYLGEQAALHGQFLQLRSQAAQALLRSGAADCLAPSVRHAAEATRAVLSVSTSVAETRANAAASPAVVDRVSGLTFSREQLETHASGRISEIFGSEFAHQDEYALQVRMPEPPLLLADRIVGMQAVPDSMGTGTVWSETDVRADSWFLHRGRVPAGVLIECGQADLFLISYLGIDRFNAGTRAYRLLGCELTYHGSAPAAGETLHFDIHVDAHARQGDIRLFFFHSDCHVGERPVLSVREGQAGFFSERELAESVGVLWSAEDESPVENPRLDPPKTATTHQNFDRQRVQAFAAGELFSCFGAGFERGQTHTHTPGIQAGKMCFIDSIEGLDATGGPWGRGYARAVTAIQADDWFFDGHFKNDSCMPGTLMFEGCLQLMAFYLASQGHTLQRDGWRFEPVPEVPYQLQCRGQVLPSSRELVCEVFVEEIWDGPEPTLFAHLLGTVDGHKAFHARNVGLRLVPDWPLDSEPERMAALSDHQAQAEPGGAAVVDGFEFGYPALLACAWGKPSNAFGPMYQPFDGTRRVARLPGPPYHFMSRVTRLEGDIGGFTAGAEVEIEYDVPPGAWYFENNGCRTMPFAVLLEAALQPCGWLASYVGSALTSDQDLAFRNLDGNGKVLCELGPDTGTLRTVSRLTNVSSSGGMIIESFAVRCYVGADCVYELDTVFGFFPAAALENQIGLATTDAQKAELAAESTYNVDLTAQPKRYCAHAPCLADPMLLMIDRVTAFDPTGGAAGLGTLRAEKDVNPDEWFFKAHFFQDPVQPGSLGIEAMLQLLQFYMLETNMQNDAQKGGEVAPQFEPIESDATMAWKYRGQVVPENKVISTTLEITERGVDQRGPFARAQASLWVDGKRIYEAQGVGVRIV